MPEMTMQQYAKHRGVSHAAVQKAIRNGRIKICRTEQRGKRVFSFIESEAADAGWANNTDLKKKTVPTRRERRQAARAAAACGKTSGKNLVRQTHQAPAASPPEASRGYLDARAKREKYAAEKAELDYKKEAKELVPAAKVKIAFANIAQNIQQNMMSIPSRLSTLVVGEFKTQGTLLLEKVAGGTPITKEELTKWIDCTFDDSVIRDLLTKEIKQILTALSTRQPWESTETDKAQADPEPAAATGSVQAAAKAPAETAPTVSSKS